MICRECGKEIPDGAKFCRHCGAKTEPEKRICPSCGAECSPTSKFCTECGAKLTVETESAPKKRTRSTKAAGTEGEPEKKTTRKPRAKQAVQEPLVIPVDGPVLSVEILDADEEIPQSVNQTRKAAVPESVVSPLKTATRSANVQEAPVKKTRTTSKTVAAAGAAAATSAVSKTSRTKTTTKTAAKQNTAPSKKKMGCLPSVLIIALIGVLLNACFNEPGWLRKPKVPYVPSNPGFTQTGGNGTGTGTTQRPPMPELPVYWGSQNGGVVVLGDSPENYTLNVESGTFKDNSSIHMSYASDEEMSAIEDPNNYEILGKPISISSTEYENQIFDTDVVLTLPIPVEAKNADAPLEQLTVIYIDEVTGEKRFMEPDSIDTANSTMKIALPHFCTYVGATVKQSQEIDLFLDKFCTKLAMSNLKQEQAAKEMGPYVQAQAEALKLSKEATSELVKKVIAEIGDMTEEGDDKVITGLATAAYESYEAGSWEALKEKSDGIIIDNYIELLSEMGMDGISTEVLKHNKDIGTIVGSFTGGDNEEGLKKTVEVLQSYIPYSEETKEYATILGSMAGGDFEPLKQKAGDLLFGALPRGELAKKSIDFIIAKTNQSFVNWKANKIEELYQIYKNGSPSYWRINEVTPRNDESFLEYLHYGYGFGSQKAVYRFYNMDKAADVCAQYGWGRKDYDELDQHYRDIFDKRAEEGLMTYFHDRLAQEDEAARLKEIERYSIEDMLTGSGALCSSNYKRFFGESEDKPYSITNRLERLVKVRQLVKQYVIIDEVERSNRQGIYTYGYLMSRYADCFDQVRTQEDRNEAIKKFCLFLKEIDLLNPLYDMCLEEDTMEGVYEFCELTEEPEVDFFDIEDGSFYLTMLYEGFKKSTIKVDKNGDFEFSIPASYSIRYDRSSSPAEYRELFENGSTFLEIRCSANSIRVKGHIDAKEQEGTIEDVDVVGSADVKAHVIDKESTSDGSIHYESQLNLDFDIDVFYDQYKDSTELYPYIEISVMPTIQSHVTGTSVTVEGDDVDRDELDDIYYFRELFYVLYRCKVPLKQS